MVRAVFQHSQTSFSLHYAAISRALIWPDFTFQLHYILSPGTFRPTILWTVDKCDLYFPRSLIKPSTPFYITVTGSENIKTNRKLLARELLAELYVPIIS